VLAKEVTVFLPLEVRSVDEEEELQYARPVGYDGEKL